jgi:ABC-type Fe3+-siderophore transport system permease subunit
MKYIAILTALLVGAALLPIDASAQSKSRNSNASPSQKRRRTVTPSA